MNEATALSRMIAPNTRRPNKWLGGVIQIHVTRACNLACFACTQGSNLAGKPVMITPDEFRMACESLKGYWGVVGVFGGCPTIHPQFEELCAILRETIPSNQRGLWANDPLGKGKTCRETFNPAVSNLNVHMVRSAYDEFKRDWPESRPFGLDSDSRHSPPYVAMEDVLRKTCGKCLGAGRGTWDHDTGCELTEIECDACGGSGTVYDHEKGWELISNCDINQHWSAMVCAVPGRGLRAYFCEIAGAQAMLHAADPDWPDVGVPVHPGDSPAWWQHGMTYFREQVRLHCTGCGVPLRRYGQLAMSGDHEEVSAAHADVYRTKVPGRRVELVTVGMPPPRTLDLVTDYVGNGRR